MRTFRVYFTDGNQKLFEAPSVKTIVLELVEITRGMYSAYDITKVEEVK